MESITKRRVPGRSFIVKWVVLSCLLLLVACGGEDADSLTSPTPSSSPTAAATATAAQSPTVAPSVAPTAKPVAAPHTPGPVLETISVPVNGGGAKSQTVLQKGIKYIITASGTFKEVPGDKPADAEYKELNSSPLDKCGSVDVGIAINNQDIAWGAYNSSHVYSTTLDGTGAKEQKTTAYVDGQLGFVYRDCGTGDNSGMLSVTIRRA